MKFIKKCIKNFRLTIFITIGILILLNSVDSISLPTNYYLFMAILCGFMGISAYWEDKSN